MLKILAEYEFEGIYKNCKCQILGDKDELSAYKDERDKSLGILAEKLLLEEQRNKAV